MGHQHGCVTGQLSLAPVEEVGHPGADRVPTNKPQAHLRDLRQLARIVGAARPIDGALHLLGSPDRIRHQRFQQLMARG